jgi:Ni,Fe-hydrogenase III component G
MEDIIARLKEKLSNIILKYEEKSGRRIYITVKPEDLSLFVKLIFHELCCRFATATGIDTPSGIEIIYHFSHDPTGRLVNLKVLIADKKHPQIESITPLITGAEWIEREIWELLGVNFIGHPNLKHLLLIDEWPEGEYPLRHDKKHKQ